jgi:hypothetical protein
MASHTYISHTYTHTYTQDAEFIGISACHASVVEVLGCTVQGCCVGALLVNDEARMTVQVRGRVYASPFLSLSLALSLFLCMCVCVY